MAQHFFIHFCGKPPDDSSKPLCLLKKTWQVNGSSEEKGILCFAGWMRRSFGALWASPCHGYHCLLLQLRWPCCPSAWAAAGSTGAGGPSVVVLLTHRTGPALQAPVLHLLGATSMASGLKHALDTWLALAAYVYVIKYTHLVFLTCLQWRCVRERRKQTDCTTLLHRPWMSHAGAQEQ